MPPVPKLPAATSHCKLLIWDMPRESDGRVSAQELLPHLVPVVPTTARRSSRAGPGQESPRTTPWEEGQGDGQAHQAGSPFPGFRSIVYNATGC